MTITQINNINSRNRKVLELIDLEYIAPELMEVRELFIERLKLIARAKRGI